MRKWFTGRGSHRCGYCGSRQHNERLCPKTHRGSTLRQLIYCTYCGSREHEYEACPKITPQHRRDPDRYFTD